MTNLRIYKLAIIEVMRGIDMENERLKENPENRITKHRLETLKAEEKKLHSLIIKEESKAV